jgi:hypothetical protein
MRNDKRPIWSQNDPYRTTSPGMRTAARLLLRRDRNCRSRIMAGLVLLAIRTARWLVGRRRARTAAGAHAQSIVTSTVNNVTYTYDQ